MEIEIEAEIEIGIEVEIENKMEMGVECGGVVDEIGDGFACALKSVGGVETLAEAEGALFAAAAAAAMHGLDPHELSRCERRLEEVQAALSEASKASDAELKAALDLFELRLRAYDGEREAMLERMNRQRNALELVDAAIAAHGTDKFDDAYAAAKGAVQGAGLRTTILAHQERLTKLKAQVEILAECRRASKRVVVGQRRGRPRRERSTAQRPPAP